MKMEDLQETAGLAHLTMSEQALAAAFPAFEQMLGFFAAMQAADEDREAFPALPSQLFGPSRIVSQDHFRQDNPEVPSQQDPSLIPQLLNNAGDRDGRFVLVPNVL
ncbi:MAG: aspartyl/glutamyl-tRNA amidotransferase subunit C [Treponema sp.]|jgi:aspartyl-tRNA(Asn)/glutamyl-tRNA(Gln) amidotransferase subunit C|nr:aspartyl/glutamyl-tRNA amidotransferase subunit C [Treponema sp.]